jgi:CheY-like chemotaxis protein
VGYAVSGELAVEAVRKRPYDVVLLDYNLGAGMNGAQVTFFFDS